MAKDAPGSLRRRSSRTAIGDTFGHVSTSLDSRVEGLTSAQAAHRLAQTGPNVVAEPRKVTPSTSVFRQLRDPLILVLLAAAILTSATGDFTDAAVIGLVIVVNTTVGVAQELRADRAVAALSALSAPKARVRRDGADAQIPARDVVPGDVLLLAQGDVVPADAVLLEAHALLVDEAALTGESVPVGKEVGIGDRHELSAGTVVVNGRAIASVTATGPHSALGRIAALLEQAPPMTPLQKRLAHLGRVLAVVALGLCGVVLASGLARGEPTERMVITSISLAVAAVPESLPAVITLSLALGARQMARRHAIVRRLPAVETLGSVTVLATDKTGTLTTGRMRAQLICTRAGCRSVEEFTSQPIDPDAEELFATSVLCNDASLPDGDVDAGLGDPTELALLIAAADAGVDRSAIDAAYPRIAELPFDSHRKLMTTVHRAGSHFLICTKGAPEAVRRICTSAGETDSARVFARAEELADLGYRVLAIANSYIDALPDDLAKVEQNLRVLGLIAVADPPKDRARTTLEGCRAAGITPVLITGDHQATASTIARRVGVVTDDEDSVVTGEQLRDGSVSDIEKVRVFARVAPDQKPDIVERWQRAGAIVAMVGDGVNDGPALRRADIGVAMGKHGTEVARQAADLVLADDDLDTVVAAIEEGRRIYANVRRFLTFGLSGGAAEILVMLIGPAFGLAVPLLAAQILWINLLTHGLTGVALGAEPAEGDAMARPPRPTNESVLGDGLLGRVVRLAVVVTATTLGIATWASDAGRPWQSMAFVALTTMQLGIAVGLRARHGRHANPFLVAAVAVSFGLALLGVYAPAFRDLLGTAGLSWMELLVVAAAGFVGWTATRIDVRLFAPRATRRA